MLSFVILYKTDYDTRTERVFVFIFLSIKIYFIGEDDYELHRI